MFEAQDFVISPEALVSSLATKLDGLWHADPIAGNKKWTPEVKKFLGEIATGLDNPAKKSWIETIYTNAQPGMGEFLLDVVWWCRSGDPTEREFMALAAEIEWASAPWRMSEEVHANFVAGKVVEDFGKLIVIKSPIKLMVFCTDKSELEKTHQRMQQKVLDQVDRYLENYAHHVPGEVYIFLDVASDGHRRAWTRTVELSTRVGLRVELG